MSRRALPELATVCWRYGSVSSLAMIVGIVLLVMTVPQLAHVNTTLAMAANWLYLFTSLLAVFGYRLLRQEQDVTSEYEKLRLSPRFGESTSSSCSAGHSTSYSIGLKVDDILV